MEVRPILAALRRHRLATLLIALEVALACAVLCNACFLIIAREQRTRLDSGVDETSLAFIKVTGYDDASARDLNARMLSGLGAIGGVQSVSAINTVPFGQNAGTVGMSLDPAMKSINAVVDIYLGGPGSFKALGVKLLAGRLPQADDYVPIENYFPGDAQVWMTRSLADHLWPGENPLGKVLYCFGPFRYRVAGVLDHLAIAMPGSRGSSSVDWSMFIPAQPGPFLTGSYLLRAAPGDIQRVMRDAHDVVAKVAPDVVFDSDDSGTISDLRRVYFQSDRAMAKLLIGVIVALLLVTALGIVGLASFWVQQRRRQIGIRRAIGATRGDILRYFHTENFLIVTMGIALGIVLAYALNIVLMRVYEVTHLPLSYLLASAVVLWLLGQLSVLGPALRAAAVPPVVATRSI